ncbi:UNVERIFIED_CONTAM: Acetylserotonin O-methyltransferase [Sesamum latifolium]|uniref:Acetylserotonin O-methyltransferase n=1 Tax=Sesamum latifolium TaxID=2727402 RepID=A0AAW2XIP7_9LAMI
METKSVKQVDEEAQARVEIWNYVFGFTPMAVMKCAIELRIADVLESHGGAMTLSHLSAALDCSSSVLHRIMRYLTHRRIFKQMSTSQESEISYVQTPLSRLLISNGENSMAAFVLMESSPVMLAPWHKLSATVLMNGTSSFEAAHGEHIWKYTAENPGHSKLFNDGMACHARLAMSTILDQYPEAFNGIRSLVNVGGGDGTALHVLVKACPWIRGINFDLPHVVSVAPKCDGIEHVCGDMFELVPKADAAFLMWVLHDWSDDECINILRKCREAIPEDKGKVIIAEAVMDVELGEDEDKYRDVRLALDMVILAHTEKGKERSMREWEYVINGAGFTREGDRWIDEGEEDKYTDVCLALDMVMLAHTEKWTIEEWEYVVKAAGFTRFTVRRIQATISVIEARP